jgi:hypothetical protein
MLQNIGDDLGLDLKELAHEVSRACPAKYNVAETDKMMSVSYQRPVDTVRKNLGHLRAMARDSSPEGYYRWMMDVMKPIVTGPVGTTMLFPDHNNFAGKTITMAMADEWVQSSLALILNGGTMYILTRNKGFCNSTNQRVQFWAHNTKPDLLSCLDIHVNILNPEYDEAIGKTLEMKEANGIKPTKEEMAKGCKYRYTKFGNGGLERGYMRDVLENRRLHVYSHEDFIPYLARCIPDKRIEEAISDPMTFNLFTGYPIEGRPLKVEGAKPYIGSAIHSHLVNSVCRGDALEYKHLEGTIADIVQRPYRVSRVAHVFYGGQGAGKSLLKAFMAGLIGGDHVMTPSDLATYFQKHNEDHKKALLKIFEEMTDSGKRINDDVRFKDEITKDTQRIEPKHQKAVTLRHMARYWFLSNYKNVIHIEHDDRRYTHHIINGDRADDPTYFNPLWKEVADLDFMRTCFEYFATLPYEEDFVCHALSTSYKQEQQIEGMSLPLKFLNHLMFTELEGAAPTARKGDFITSIEVYRLYEVWCNDNNVTAKVRQGVLATIFEGIGVSRPKESRIDGQKATWYELGHDKVRDCFRKYLKMPTFEFLAVL